MTAPIRLSVRAVILRGGRLLLVNAYRGRTDLWCAPGGGAEPHASLPENLRREVREETGLDIAVGALCLVNEFHDPAGDYHQVDLFFRAEVAGGDPDGDWTDPEGVVAARRWASRTEIASIRVKPDALARVAWAPSDAVVYDPLERLVT